MEGYRRVHQEITPSQARERERLWPFSRTCSRPRPKSTASPSTTSISMRPEPTTPWSMSWAAPGWLEELDVGVFYARRSTSARVGSRRRMASCPFRRRPWPSSQRRARLFRSRRRGTRDSDRRRDRQNTRRTVHPVSRAHLRQDRLRRGRPRHRPACPTSSAPFSATRPRFRPDKQVYVVEATIDDSNPQVLAAFLDRALELGALDVYLTPIVMKKNRLATKLTLLAAA